MIFVLKTEEGDKFNQIISNQKYAMEKKKYYYFVH